MVMWRSSLPAVLLLLCASECVAAVQEFFMSDYCGEAATVRVEKSLILHFGRAGDLPHHRADTAELHCGLNVAAWDHTNRLLLHIVSLHIDIDHADRLHVFEPAGERFHRLTPASGLFGKYGGVVQVSGDGIMDYKTRGDTFYLDYEGVPTQEFDGFTILFTEFHDVSSVTGSCFGTFFECLTARMCIDASLRCDTYRNCGEYDDSDEASCSHDLPADSSESTDDNTLPIALSVGIVATATFLLVSLAIFLVTRLRRRQIVGGHQQGINSTPEQRNGVAENGVNLATLYAPPSYEDVMSSQQTLNAENPPPYDSLVSVHIQEITPPVRRSRPSEIVQDESFFTEATLPIGSRTSDGFVVSENFESDEDTDDDTSENETRTRPNGDIVIPYQRTETCDVLTLRRADV